MNSYIFIDGPVLWIIIGFIAFLLLWVMYLSFHCMSVERTNDKLKEENKCFKTNISLKDSEIRYLKFKLSYKHPEVE